MGPEAIEHVKPEVYGEVARPQGPCPYVQPHKAVVRQLSRIVGKVVYHGGRPVKCHGAGLARLVAYPREEDIPRADHYPDQELKRVVEGQSVSLRVEPGGDGVITKNNKK